SDRAHKCEDLFLVEHRLYGFDRLLRLVAVVGRFQLEFSPQDSSGAIGLLKCRENAFAHSLTERLRRPLKGRDLAEYDLVGKDTVLGSCPRRAERQEQEQNQGRAVRFHRLVARLWTFSETG